MALTLLAVDPHGLRGLWLRGRAGPVRDRVLAALAALAPRKLHPFISDDALYGGLDLSATLATGEMQRHAGLLAQGGLLVLTMAERCPAGLAVRLGQGLDSDPALSLVALDEAAEEGEGLPRALADRLGLFVTLDDLAYSDTTDLTLPMALITTARARLAALRPTADDRARLVRICAQLQIDSARAPLLALACARAHAALRGGDGLSDADLEVAVTLTLAHRATALPADTPPDQDDTPPPPQDQPEQGADQDQSEQDIPDDLLIEAARTALPPNLLARLQAARVARAMAANSGAGAVRTSKRRGRPMPSRAGKPGSGAKVDVIATLRQAAPWQKIRAQMMPAREGLLLMPSDIRIRRYKEQTDRVLIFVVDASGSSALARLAEAKGAVELMLAEAYSSRDHVALVTFRGRGADLTLPPTRSLVQAKRRLGGVPGGGATPLAQGLALALQVAATARGQGMTPTLALLTDGRGNIALDGTADRAQAAQDAEKLARMIAGQGLPALVIDTGLRPQPALAALSQTMGALHIALPRADSRAMATSLGAALGRMGHG